MQIQACEGGYMFTTSTIGDQGENVDSYAEHGDFYV